MPRRGRRTDPLTGSEVEVAITRLGARGDGIGDTDAGPVYVPRTAPGDTVRVRRAAARGDGHAAAIVDLVTAGPSRRQPECPHFDDCGACAAQHLDAPTYTAWKQGLIADALQRRNLPIDRLQPLVACPIADRRRTQLHAKRAGRNVQLGFHAAASHDIVDLGECAVLRPSLVALLPALRDTLRHLLPSGRAVDILLTEADNGIDMLVTGDIQQTPRALETVAAFARESSIARIAHRQSGSATSEPLLQFDLPHVDIAGVSVALPSGAFLQASKTAEHKLAAFVTSGLPGCKHVADLYAGLGAFTLPLASAGSRVHAVDTDGASLAAMSYAAGQAALGGRVTNETRDLDATPLQPTELSHVDAVVFDPPRAGARRQAEVLAKAGPATVVAISCEPGTFARDAAILVAGGYRLEEVLPVDQFVYSSKLEVAARFRR